MAKNLLVLLTCLLLPRLMWANNHFSFDMSEQCMSIDDVKDSLFRWFDMDGTVDFKVFADDIDNVGFRHVALQQYYDGIAVDGHIVLAHSKNGYVQSVNGLLMLPSEFSDNKVSGSVLKSTKVGDVKIVFGKFNGQKAYRKCHEMMDPENSRLVYVDVETGDTVKILYKRYDVTARGYTMYHGWQDMSCVLENGKCCLKNDLIETYYAGGNISYPLDPNNFEVVKYRDGCEMYRYPSSVMGGILKSVTISSANSSWWYATLVDTQPDFYIVIEDANGNCLYKSAYKTDQSVPVTFDLSPSNNVFLSEGSVLKIYDYDPANSDDYGGAVTITNVEPGIYTWSGINTSGTITISPNPAIDAHWGMERVNYFYFSQYDRKGYNNLGTKIYQFIDPYSITGTHFFANAWAACDKTGIGYMVYGLGDDYVDDIFSDSSIMKPVVALDVMAHEFTHLVIGFNGHGGLDNQGESGALNESFADIMGTAVEFYTFGSDANWSIGEDVMLYLCDMRRLDCPKKSACHSKDKYVSHLLELCDLTDVSQLPEDAVDMINEFDGSNSTDPHPDTYKGEYWIDTEADSIDNGGVHRNSGVQNYWFYLLSEGGFGVNDNGNPYDVKGIGIEKATQIAYRNFTYYLTPQATFVDAVDGSMNAAADLYGKKSEEQKSVYDAWCAVGLCSDKYNHLFSGNADIGNSSGTQVYVEDGALCVMSEKDSYVRVCDVLGRCMYFSSLKANELTRFPIGTNVLLFVKVGTETFKCVAK
ncbi:MAG: M4 family metallopeptidase [Paludibacteraceae bacterium]|nr:M4 family metallopeptidase [Paludibacteraceae bacterium]